MYIYKKERLKGLRAPYWISEVYAGFHVICIGFILYEKGEGKGGKGKEREWLKGKERGCE